MYEYIISIKNQFDLYFDILKFFFYFCIGAILLFLLKKIFKFFQLLTYKFNKDISWAMEIKEFINAIEQDKDIMHGTYEEAHLIMKLIEQIYTADKLWAKKYYNS